MVLEADCAASGLRLNDISIDEKIRRQVQGIEVEVDDSPADFF